MKLFFLASVVLLSACTTCYDLGNPEERNACFARERQAEIDNKKPATREDRIFCNQKKRDGVFKNNGECIAFLAHPAGFICRDEKAKSQDALDKCVFALEHPAEAKCQEEEKARPGSYYQCLAIERESIERDKDRKNLQQINAANIAEDRAARRQQVLRSLFRETRCTTGRGLRPGTIDTTCRSN